MGKLETENLKRENLRGKLENRKEEKY